MIGLVVLLGSWLAIVAVTVDGWRHPTRAWIWLLLLLMAPFALVAAFAGPPASAALVAAFFPHRVDPAIRATLLAGAISEAANGTALVCSLSLPAVPALVLLMVSAHRAKGARE